ncbi:FUSC family protein [Streptomyces tateyamensis]|uniref:FUSC family protein n=1 Tax=Streptomyces tateyamensis TaxID=565073 RepID=A0A2V4NEI6_9ACTN|nr:FUSC family protein [Streptomyces tateyamensis]PYC80259.1 FUSC family protein [Streptomyces tateyamensis]
MFDWLRAHDPDLAATRRAGRTALVMPALFAFCTEVLHAPTVAGYAAFGGISMLLLVDFSGPMAARLRAQAGLALAWAVLITLGTLAAGKLWLAVTATVLVGFAVLFAGVVSSVLAGSSTALLLAFVLPVSAPAPLGQLPERLAGAGLAALVALPAVALLWPRPVADPLRAPAALVCRAAAQQLRLDTARLDTARLDTGRVDSAGLDTGRPGGAGGHTAHPGAADRSTAADCWMAAERTAEAATALRTAFDATPYRPTGLSLSSRALVRLVDELTWLCAVVADRPTYAEAPPACDPAARTVRLAVADVLERAADLLTDLRAEVAPLRAAVRQLESAVAGLEHSATVRLPVDRAVGERPAEVYGFIATLDLSFRAQELGFAVRQIAGNVELAATAWQRRWADRLLGREPGALTGPLAAARERAAAHLGLRSVWLHNSLRGGVGLGIAVLLAELTSVQHGFWVLLGTLSVLRSNALSTGQNAARAVGGTLVGSVLGAGLLQLIGHHGTLLWLVLPVAVLCAGIAPAAISFAAGQAAFTVTLAVLFNIGQDPDWHIVLLRIQDIGLGCAVSLVVALFFWPRGAAAAVDKALAEAYTDSAGYLAGAVDYALGHAGTAAPERERRTAAAAARRLDDAYRSYLAERGAKPLSLADTTTLVTGVVGLRLAADAVVSLWQHPARPTATDGEGVGGAERSAECGADCRAVGVTGPGAERGAFSETETEAHRAIQGATTRVTAWYRGLARTLDGRSPLPSPVELHPEAAARLVGSVRSELTDPQGRATPTAVRLIWTRDHVDVARRLQPSLAAAVTGHE